jgi:phospholipase C
MVDRGQIDHVAVIMLENRSFDHVLGGLKGIDGLDGLHGMEVNPDLDGSQIIVRSTTRRTMSFGPLHDFESVAYQLAGNSGFVTNAQAELHLASADAAQVMEFYPDGELPVIHALAHEYLVLDRWFCSVPTGTLPNRMFAVAGTSDGRLRNEQILGLLPAPCSRRTIFEAMGFDRAQWANYCDGMPTIWLFSSLWGEARRSRHRQDSLFRSIDQFEEDCRDGALPKFSFIEPVYWGDGADDGHPPHDFFLSDQLVGRIYMALRESAIWNRSCLIVLFDEHGGFYDHVTPPADSVPPDGQRSEEFPAFGFGRLGPRVPCVVVSPWVDAHRVWRPDHGALDHSSLVATVGRRWSIPALTARDGAAPDIWPALARTSPREDDAKTLKYIANLVSEAAAGPLFAAPGRSWGRDRMIGASSEELALAITGSVARAPDDAMFAPPTGSTRPRDVDLETALQGLAAAFLAET